MEENYFCKKCGEPIDDIALAMVSGCSCGSRVFKQGTKVSDDELSKVQNQGMSDDISILVKEKGVYAVNIKTLIERENPSDPIFVQDTRGKINVLFNPDA